MRKGCRREGRNAHVQRYVVCGKKCAHASRSRQRTAQGAPENIRCQRTPPLQVISSWRPRNHGCVVSFCNPKNISGNLLRRVATSVQFTGVPSAVVYWTIVS